MSQTKLRYPSIYNPASQSAEEIVANFVIRLHEFRELFSAIKNCKMDKPSQHFMIQGQRGYGKTSLLLRLNHEIENDKELSQWLLPVMFDEEQYNVHTLAKLWEEVIDVLEDQYASFAGLSDKIDPLYDTDSPEEEIFTLLVNALKKENKRIVLLLDNFGDMIEKFTRKENQRLREVLITCKYLRIIGASSTFLEFYYSYKEPLFDFFKVITLDELNSEETISLLKKLGETYNTGDINKIIETQPARIEALRRLTGGVPRTIVLLFEIFIDDVDGNSFKDLEAILDRITPLYKHRMETLSTQQQTIVDAIAQNWDAISTKDIANRVRMSSKAVSSQLNQLEKSQLIKKISTSTKNHLYQLNERFFNIYYLMRLGKRKNRNKVLWLVRFFELWCGEKELAERAQRHIKAMQRGRLYDSHAFCISQALAKIAIPDELQHELITETKEYLLTRHSELVEELDKSHKEVIEEVTEDILHERISSAKKTLLNNSVPKENIGLAIGNIVWDKKKDIRKAVECYLESVKEGNTTAMFNLALLYQTEFKDFEKAKEYYLMAVEGGDSDAVHNLAFLYRTEFKDYEKAKKYYLMAIEKGNSDAMFSLALLYQTEFKDFEKAKEYYLMAVEGGHSNAAYNLAFLYQTEFKDFEKAKEYYLMAVREGHSEAMHNLALLYDTEFKDYEKAKEYYLMAIEKGDYEAMPNLALLYKNKLRDYKNAEKYSSMGVKQGNIEAMCILSTIYLELKKNKDEALRLKKNVYVNKRDLSHAQGYVITLLWNNEIGEAIRVYKEDCDSEAIYKEVDENIYWIFLMFLAKKQYHFVFQLFEQNRYDLRDKYKPIYFALLLLMGDEYKDEYLKMGDELKQTVDEVLTKIKQMETDYA